MKHWTYEHRIGSIELSVQNLGDHMVICISGGDRAHIGSIVLAQARPSLSGNGTSATSSVLNRVGHKDEMVAREVAEVLAAKLNTVVCCICGIHKDDASEDDIRASLTLGSDLTTFLLENAC